MTAGSPEILSKYGKIMWDEGFGEDGEPCLKLGFAVTSELCCWFSINELVI